MVPYGHRSDEKWSWIHIYKTCCVVRNGLNIYLNVDTDPPIYPAMGFPVRTKGTGNTEHMFSQWGLVGTGNREQGTSHETP